MKISGLNQLDAYDVQMVVAYTILHDVIGIEEGRTADREQRLTMPPHRQANMQRFFDEFHRGDDLAIITEQKHRLRAKIKDYLFQQSIQKDENDGGYNRALLTLAAILGDDLIIGYQRDAPRIPSLLMQDRIARTTEAALKLHVLLSEKNGKKANWATVARELVKRSDGRQTAPPTRNENLQYSNFRCYETEISKRKTEYLDHLEFYGHPPRTISSFDDPIGNERQIEPFMVPWEPSETEMDEVPE